VAAAALEDEQARLAQDLEVLGDARRRQAGELDELPRRARAAQAGAEELATYRVRERPQELVQGRLLGGVRL